MGRGNTWAGGAPQRWGLDARHPASCTPAIPRPARPPSRLLHARHPASCTPIPRLTHHGEVDLGLPAAQFVLHQQGVAAAVLLARRPDGELAALLTVLHLDVLAVLDLGAERGAGAGDLSQKGRGLQATPHTP